MKSIINKAIIFVGIAVGLASAMPAIAQTDPHFTQYYVYPSWMNPALTGAFDGQYRVSAIYRNQWGSISSPYSTQGFTGELTTNANMNFGLSLLNQTAGDGGYRYNTGYVNLAFTGVRFGANGYDRLALGLQAGLIQRRFDGSKLKFGDQWNPVTGYNSSNPTLDALNNKKVSSFDVGAGAMYFNANPNTKANFYAGFAAAHLTKPKDEFSGNENEKYPMRLTGHAGIRIKLSDNFSVTPNALFLKQGTAQEVMVGAYAQAKAGAETDFLFGANYRFNDALSPFAGFAHKQFVIGASYDVTTSDLGKVVKGTNGFEISLSFTGRKKISTPAVEFVCPRL